MKHPNPVKGYIQCPQCPQTATVHQTGEGELIATGKPPKNSRNIGLKYYKCPSCGNSSISKSCDSFIEKNMVHSDEQLEKPIESGNDLNGNTPSSSSANSELFNALESVDLSDPLTVVETSAQASNDEALSGEVITEDEQKASHDNGDFSMLKRVAIALVFLAFVLWSVSKLLPKKDKGESDE